MAYRYPDGGRCGMAALSFAGRGGYRWAKLGAYVCEQLPSMLDPILSACVIP